MRQLCARAVLGWMLAGAALALAPVALADEHGAPVLRWDPARLGNHRYLVQVDAPAEAVRAVIPWRRRDAHPEKVAVIVTDPDGAPVANVLRGNIDRASGELVFQAAKAGTYAVYYQPYVGGGRSNYPVVNYAAPRDSADPAWAGKLGKRWDRLPQAQVQRYEAVDDFDAYTDMERTATPAELDALLARHAEPLLLFPETRANPVRMFDTLPVSWTQRGPGGALSDHAQRGEYLSFQVGLWAPRTPVNAVRVAFGDLHGPDGATIPATALTCFNLRGIDYAGRPFVTRVDVPKGRVQPLWMGLDVPADLDELSRRAEDQLTRMRAVHVTVAAAVL